jgi:hypothetical protein
MPAKGEIIIKVHYVNAVGVSLADRWPPFSLVTATFASTLGTPLIDG